MSIHLDFETRSTVDLKSAGIGIYARHPTTDVWVLCFAINDGPVEVWRPGEAPPRAITRGELFHAWNAVFEFEIWNNILVPRYGFPPVPITQFRCTMAQSFALSLPGSLDMAAIALSLPVQKDKDGHALMMRMARPRKLEPLTWWDDEERIARLIAYCKTDVEVERMAGRRLYPLSEDAQRLWVLDHQINSRGVQLDLVSVGQAQLLVAVEAKKKNAELAALTGGEVSSAMQTAKLGEWIASQGVALENLQKDTVTKLIEAAPAGIFADAATVALGIRALVSKTSTSKLRSMQKSASPDGRARFLLQFHAAGTGRWGGRRVQPQNLFRPMIPQAAIEACISALNDGHPELIELFGGEPLDTIASCLRAMIVAATGYRLLAADFANIEGRVLAWLAGEVWKVQAFRDFDKGIGADIYKLSYIRAFGTPIADITWFQRLVGKVMELALGYGGGFDAFKSMAKNYGLNVIDGGVPAERVKGALYRPEVEDIKKAWRAAHPKIADFNTGLWADLQSASLSAVRRPGVAVEAAGGKVAYKVKGAWLFCKLPSGRLIAYAKPRIERGRFGSNVLGYDGVDTFTKKWGPQQAWGGLLAENVTQAVACCILIEAIERVERQGYPVVLHVHDEIVSELPHGRGLLKVLCQLMAVKPAWCRDLPIAVEGWEGQRYRK